MTELMAAAACSGGQQSRRIDRAAKHDGGTSGMVGGSAASGTARAGRNRRRCGGRDVRCGRGATNTAGDLPAAGERTPPASPRPGRAIAADREGTVPASRRGAWGGWRTTRSWQPGSAGRKPPASTRGGRRDRNDPFLPNGRNRRFLCLVASEEAVSLCRNDFYEFASLSSFIDPPCHLFCLCGIPFNGDRNHH